MKGSVRSWFIALLAIGVWAFHAPAFARGDDDDDEGPNGGSFCEELSGAAFGLCNAFCNAQQCYLQHKHSCDVLRDNFERQTGRSTFPCEADSPFRTATPTRTPAGDQNTATATRTPVATATRMATRTRTASPTFAVGTATATRTAKRAHDVCDDLEEGAHGLCNAFCNAQHCHIDPHPSCEVLRRNFLKQTGSSVFPCEIAVTPSATATGPTPTETATVPPGSTPTATAEEEEDECMGDCNEDRLVTIDDLTKCTAIALGIKSRSECHSSRVHDLTIADLILAVRHALEGCS